MKHSTFYLLVGILVFSCMPAKEKNQVNPTQSKPNILLVIADDLGLTDLGCYGGEIHTPTIDSLAQSGKLFTNFHSAAMCAPARSKLFSGQDHHQAGWGRQRDVSGSFYEGLWGYENEISVRVLCFPRLFQEAGYFTSFVGKWHLGSSPSTIPAAQGFDKSFALMQGAANHWNDVGLGLSDKDGKVSSYFQDNHKVSWPEGQYSTNFYTSETIKYLSENRIESQPFLSVVSYTAPHWPLQPPSDYKDRYRGKYDRGYDDLREQRFNTSKRLGMIEESVELPEGLKHIKPWESLTKEEQKIESREMELYAASLEHLDAQLGELLNHLRATGELENTIVLFMSDNGADFLDFYNNEKYGQFLREKYDNSYDNMGNPNSFVAYGAAWAQASMSPYSYYKGYLAEGGLRAPLIISGTNIKAENQVDQLVDVTDLAPTLLSLAEIEYKETFKGKSYPSLPGRSFKKLLQENGVHEMNTPTYVSDFQGKAYVRKDQYKWLNQKDPSKIDQFELFNLDNDPGERNDLSVQHPNLIKELKVAWDNYRDKYHVKYPEDTSDLNPYKK